MIQLITLFQQQIEQGETAPPFAEPLIDHRSVTFAGDDAQSYHHFLNEIADRQEKQEHPEQIQTVLGPCLRIGRNCAGVIIGLHYDQAGAKYHQKRQQISEQWIFNPVAALRGAEFIGCTCPVHQISLQVLLRFNIKAGVLFREGRLEQL